MNTEKLIAKGVKHKFNGQETLFDVESLNEHFDGLLIHETDIDDDNHVKVGDVNFDSATANEVVQPPIDEIEVVVTEETLTIDAEEVNLGNTDEPSQFVNETITIDAIEDPVVDMIIEEVAPTITDETVKE